MKTDVVARIHHFNQGRDPKLLKLKYQAMRQNIFGFFRGTCHLFYEDWPVDSSLNTAPPVWICGDLHLENFGSYKGDNRLVYFDINDFDEAVLAPCTWDVARLITSVLVAAHTLKVDEEDALHLCDCFLDAYGDALAQGKARSVETETAQGMVKDLLESLLERRRKDFLNKLTEEKKNKRRLLLEGKHFFSIPKAQHSAIKNLIADWAAMQPEPDFFKVLDVAGRIAGTASLGIGRYVLLIEGKGSPHQNYLLDLKQARRSSLAPYLRQPQPQWVSEAARIVAIQQRMQGTSPALLATVMLEGEPYVLRELQPEQDRVSLNLWEGKLRRLERVMQAMGSITAWDQLRSGGRQGSAIADTLIQYGTEPDWRGAVINYARDYFAQVQEDYRAFCLEMGRG